MLRRFSYTESDVYYQLDKIRSAYGVAEWSEPFFNNRALFSDYYLNERLPQLPEWQADAAPAFRALSKLLADAREKFAGKRESELRTLLYQPLFAALGWKAEVQKAGHEDDARADYVLSDASGSRVPCLTYVWDRYLDGPDETRDNETPRENPAQTVVGLLDHDRDGGWAIVTNGKVWRLYSARAHSRATNYYEIDLEETLASPDVDVAFRYYWLFFRGTPIPSPSPVGDRGREKFLDFLLDESASFAKALGERLKDRVFGEVFPYFAEGFIKHGHERPSTAPRGSAQDAWTDDDLVVAFQATLTFLYRLLFVLYAEARDLLPVRETRGYWEVSLQRIKEEIAGKAGNLEDEVNDRLEKAYSAGETTLYDRLLKLFRVIDRGAAELNVPIYNGGLFQTELSGTEDQSSLEAARFLQSHKIPDRYLALGLDRMARDIDARRGDLVAIDYKSLGVRHLGSIYEGLLEFRLRIAREKMAVVRGKKTDEVIPAREAGDAKIKATLPKGAAYLENDKHERKATGSYYTPDYIVKYIVQHTVGPVLDEKFEALRPRLRQAAKRFDETVKRKQTIEHAAPDRPALLNDVAERSAARSVRREGARSGDGLRPLSGGSGGLHHRSAAALPVRLPLCQSFLRRPARPDFERVATAGSDGRSGAADRRESAEAARAEALHLRRRSQPDGGGTGQGERVARLLHAGRAAVVSGSSPEMGQFADRCARRRSARRGGVQARRAVEHVCQQPVYGHHAGDGFDAARGRTARHDRRASGRQPRRVPPGQRCARAVSPHHGCVRQQMVR